MAKERRRAVPVVWEYKVTANVYNEDTAVWLNRLGDAGWELVMPTTGIGYIFKRPKVLE